MSASATIIMCTIVYMAKCCDLAHMHAMDAMDAMDEIRQQGWSI